jgi:DNA-binding FadR family transcriptional regulator
MTVIEKVKEYLNTHKKPVTIKQLADRFLLSKTGVREALMKLEKQGNAQRQKTGSTDFWSFKAQPFDGLAVPKAPNPKPRTPAFVRPIQNSYPAIRGYDD